LLKWNKYHEETAAFFVLKPAYEKQLINFALNAPCNGVFFLNSATDCVNMFDIKLIEFDKPRRDLVKLLGEDLRVALHWYFRKVSDAGYYIFRNIPTEHSLTHGRF